MVSKHSVKLIFCHLLAPPTVQGAFKGLIGSCITVLLKLNGPTTSDERGGKQISQMLMNGKGVY